MPSLTAPQLQAFSAMVTSGGTCRITSPITLSSTATPICVWPIPAGVTLAWDCHIPYSMTAGTLPTLSLGMNASQAPTNETGYALIGTSNVGAFVSGTATSAAAGAVNILQGGTVTNNTFQAFTFGTIVGSATAGTFTITATLSGSGAAGTIPAGGVCMLL